MPRELLNERRVYLALPGSSGPVWGDEDVGIGQGIDCEHKYREEINRGSADFI
jgi:hypothetical protein